ncbi:MAG: phosphate ABC transporter substrate-binding protein PstS [Dysgonamonadaceae bacterium]|jgi:phosphate transport system substrate-binding protein|nr:phosphate ABC transporter substrate-binding protein PstS [Dysgonamonadaceae bacterium]
MKKTSIIGILVVLMLCECGQECNFSRHAGVLTGLGDTFPQIFYDIVIPRYMSETGNKIVYYETTSGEGNRIFYDKIFDFLVADAFLTDNELIECEADVLHIPCSLGAVVLAFNVQGVERLNLNSSVITAIYMGKITNWNDSAIAKINPGMNLPNQPIYPVYRSDGNGASYLLSDFLSQTCHEWKKKTGVRKTLKFDVGFAVRGNISVATAIKNCTGSIGYISMDLASLLDLPVAAIQNSSGNFVYASRQSLQSATQKEFPDDMRIVFTNSKNDDAYPIPCLSWILVYRNQAYNHHTMNEYQSLISFLNYIVSPEVQIRASKLTDSPLPLPLIEKAQTMIQSVKWEE